MQNQFDSWYSQLQSRGGSVSVALTAPSQTRNTEIVSSEVESAFCIGFLPSFFLNVQHERKKNNDCPPQGNEDTNEDIAAFYKAKDALLKRREEAK